MEQCYPRCGQWLDMTRWHKVINISMVVFCTVFTIEDVKNISCQLSVTEKIKTFSQRNLNVFKNDFVSKHW